jgi:hypothetical protein
LGGRAVIPGFASFAGRGLPMATRVSRWSSGQLIVDVGHLLVVRGHLLVLTFGRPVGVFRTPVRLLGALSDLLASRDCFVHEGAPPRCQAGTQRVTVGTATGTQVEH